MKVNFVKTFLFLFIFYGVLAQNVENPYLPQDMDSLRIYLKKINTDLISSIEGDFSSRISKVFKNRDEKIIEMVEDSAFIFNYEIKNKLNNVLDHIYITNPEINSTNYYFFINNSMLPNAACYGDGMFQINLGLFTKLDSDDELAFVICHEIAHKLLEHPLKGVTKNVSVLNSKETKSKIKEIKKNKYGQYRATLSVIDEMLINILDHSKEVEAEADSLGFILFSKTKYEKVKALTALENLKRVDEMVFHYDVKIDSVFNLNNYPFKPYWLKKSKSLFDTDTPINDFELVSDTLKTHPEITYRVAKLAKEHKINREVEINSESKEYLNIIKNIAFMASIDYAYDKKFLDLVLYMLIERFNKHQINNEYYYPKMAVTLRRLYNIKKSHEIGKYVLPDNSLSDEKQLNTIRLFLHNLEFNEIKKMGLAFCEMHEKKVNSKEFETVKSFFEKINQ